MPVRRQLIEKITVGSNTASVTFSNIPQNFKDLKIVISARMSDTAAIQTVRLRYNDISANYQSRFLYYNGTVGSALSGVTTYGAVGDVNATVSLSNTFGSVEINIPNYTSSVNKTTHTYAAAPNNASASWIGNSVIGFPSTSPITKIQIYADTIYQFLANSTFYLYGITHVPIINGGEVSIRDGFKYHTFRSTSTLQVVEPGDAQCLVVAGGGGGGREGGGGGGAGGLRAFSTRLSKGLTSVVVGGGGIAGTVNKGGSGSNSALGSITATGGGGGASGIDGYGNGIAGGSGGGGSGTNPNSNTQGGSGVSGQGFSGGGTSSANSGGAGGGGATAVGGNGGSSNAGAGGAGFVSPFNGFAYAGGGGGGQYWGSFPGGAGGIGGGGAGGNVNGGPGTSGVTNTGGGGGGGGNQQGIGGAGGSGIVVIRYPYDGN